ncbi:MAG: SGNH/GDSL hydrolase family protein [Bacteroidaceae bacterium]|nr:SGNH/GDSL hydrolase family protein [Bacteroidaceae bacterium]MBP5731445.1 SGNH/GDSL hydrolase family protein [Bacteroidaceae bacterium]
MKKVMLFIAAMAFVGTMCAQQDWANFKRYEDSNKEVKTWPQSQRRVVFMGNSITDNWAARHADFFKENGYVGRGISGQTTYQMVLRFYEDVIALKPKAVVINGGTNDIAQNNHPYVEERTFQNIVAMAQMAKQNGIKVILTSITPCDHYSWSSVTDVIAKIKSLNARVKAYAKKNKMQYVDYFSAMADERGAMREGISEEGCHPNAAGYAVMGPLVKAAVDKVVKK